MAEDRRYKKELQKPFPNRKETKQQVCARRNMLLREYFSQVKENIKIFGNPERPSLILDNSFAISAYVHNFNLNFTNKQYNGEIIASFKLTSGSMISQDAFNPILKQLELKKIFRLRYSNTDLYLAGYNFKDPEGLKDKYPVFSRHNYKLYFNEDRVLEIIKEFENYPLDLI